MTEDWSTPQDFFDKLDKEFHFTIDVCAFHYNAKCQKYISPEQDAFTRQWRGICWMNPPYGRKIGRWIRKAYTESEDGATVVCLVPAKTETSWWHDYCMLGEVRFVRGRLWFTDANGKTGRPRFGSAVVIFRPEKER